MAGSYEQGIEPQKTGNFLTSWVTKSFSQKFLHHEDTQFSYCSKDEHVCYEPVLLAFQR
jgi:hypothetical protein